MFTLKLVLFGLVGFIPFGSPSEQRELWSVLPNTSALEDPIGCIMATHSMVGAVVEGRCTQGCTGLSFVVPGGSRVLLPPGTPRLNYGATFDHVISLEALTSRVGSHGTVRDGCRAQPWSCRANGVLAATTGTVNACHLGEHHDDYYVDAVQIEQQMTGGMLTLDFLDMGTNGPLRKLVVEPINGAISIAIGNLPLKAEQIQAAVLNSGHHACLPIHHMQHFGALYRFSRLRPSETDLRQIALPHVPQKPNVADCDDEVAALVNLWHLANEKPEAKTASPLSTEVCGNGVFNRVP